MSDNIIFQAPDRRAKHYREQAAQVRELAEADQRPSFRAGLLEGYSLSAIPLNPPML